MPKQNAKPTASSSSTPVVEKILVSDLRQDVNIWFKILVLLYDFSNFAKDAQSEMRLNCTIHMLYISEPYFRDFEADSILGATLDVDEGSPKVSVEEAIYRAFENFAEKTKASGDSRPSGPHGLLPVYCDIFGVSKDELKDEKFLSRLRRSCIGGRQSVKSVVAAKNEGTKEKHTKPNRGKLFGCMKS